MIELTEMSDPRPLNSEELGDLGEDRFSLLCKEGVPRLIVNKSLKDMTGWDFIVEFPRDATDGAPLDSRRNPISARFQQKSMWIDNDRIRFTLSALERLAKDANPSFICALKFDRDLICRECYLIHLLDDNLVFVLTKLREAISSGKQANHIDVYMNASDFGNKIDVNHASLVREIRVCVGDDLTNYIKRKAGQLDELGFEAKRFDFSFAVAQQEASKISDALLGIGGEIEIDALEGGETRFGIRLPLPFKTGSVKLSLMPTPMDTCNIRFQSEDRTIRESVGAVVYGVPPAFQFDNNAHKLRFSSKTIDIIVSDTGGTITVKETRNSDFELDLQEWLAHFRICNILIDGGGRFDIIRRGQTIRGSMFGEKLKIHGKANVDEEISVLEKIIALRAAGSLRAGVSAKLGALDKIKKTVGRAYTLVIEKEPFEMPDFQVEWTEYDAVPEQLRGYIIDYIKMDDDVFVFVARVIATKKLNGFTFEVLAPEIEDRNYFVCSPDEYPEMVDEYRNSDAYPLLISSDPPEIEEFS